MPTVPDCPLCEGYLYQLKSLGAENLRQKELLAAAVNANASLKAALRAAEDALQAWMARAERAEQRLREQQDAR